LVLFLIFFLAILVLNRLFSSGGGAATMAAKDTQCLAAREDIQPGTFLESKDLLWRDCRAAESQATARDYVWRESSESGEVGSVARTPYRKGDLILARDLIRPGDGDFLSAVLKSGFRAAAIRVDDVTGGAGLIRPGNLVDVIVSGKFSHGGGHAEEIATAKTLLRGVRVLAVDRDVVLQDSPRPEQRASSSSSSGKSKGTVTLEVAPKEVELLTVARTMGVLSLALCSLDDGGEAGSRPSYGPTVASEIVAPIVDGEPAQNVQRPVVTLFGAGQGRHGNR
jgi:pilus assembly protein CpaB